MDRHTIIVTLDKRQEKLGVLLPGTRIRCSFEEYQKVLRGTEEKIYVLPIPIAKLGEKEGILKKLKEELIKEERAKVFAGAITKEWQVFFEENNIMYWDFMKLPEVVEGNAWITAESVIAETLQNGQHMIQGQKVLVTGYGCCGAKVAELFSKLGADVTVVARRAKIREQIVKDGFRAIDFSDMFDVADGINTIVNTVPAMVITETVISKLAKDALIVDIASRPGGTDFDAAKRHGICAKLALGLPGIYTTTSSAKLLKDAISKYAPLHQDVREDSLWIFQIVI